MSKIEEYAAILGLDITQPLTEADVDAAYREAAKRTHPDAGGDATEFHRVIDARAVVMGHVRRQSPQSALPDGRARCARCKGQGTVESRRAWRTMTVRCPECKGTGASG